MSLFPLASPLRACCDDFWSCAAAVATGGLSCAVEDLINSIRTLIQNVSKLASTLGQQAMDVVNLAKNELSGAANDLRNLASQAESDFNSAAQTAQAIVSEASRPQMLAPQAIGALAAVGAVATRPGVGGTATSRPAPPQPAGGSPMAHVGGAVVGGAAMHFDPPASPRRSWTPCGGRSRRWMVSARISRSPSTRCASSPPRRSSRPPPPPPP